MAKLSFSYGSMNSGKTSELLMLAHNLKTNNIKYLIFKPDIDTRSPLNVVKSRIGSLESTAVTIYQNTNIYESVCGIINNSEFDNNTLKYLLIDEAQFLTPIQVEELANIVDILSINVFCYGLKGDYKTIMFPGSKRLFELSDEQIEFPSICICGEKAILNGRFNEFGQIVKDGNQIDIGGDEKYTPLCRKCYKNIWYNN